MTQWIISEFAVVSWRGGRIALTSTTSGLSFVDDDVELLRVAHAFAKPRSIEDVVREIRPAAPAALERRIDDLIRGGILIPAGETESAALHHWDWRALACHRASREAVLVRPVGEPEQRTTHPAKDWIPLGAEAPMRGRDFADVLEARRSLRRWSTASMPLATLSQLLWLSARDRTRFDRSTQKDGGSRPYPSGGGLYSLEIYPVIGHDAIESCGAGVYRYVSQLHGLEVVPSREADVAAFLDAAARSAGSDSARLVLIVTSRIGRVGERYGSLAYSLVLKEVGCLLQTLYLAAEYLDVGACVLGGGTPAGRLARLCSTSEVAEPVVGEFIVGPR